jgi:hypothetical protein
LHGDALRAGLRGAAVAQFRGPLQARVQFDFREWGKLQMALACGSQHMNVLATVTNADPQPSGGTALSAVALLPGSTAQELIFGVGAVDFFSTGDLLAVDMDYQQETGYVGTGVAAAYIKDAGEVRRDPNYIRRVTFNVGRVAEKTATSVILAQALMGGAPAAGAAAQKVIAFVDREGGAFFQEWSGLFVLPEESGGRVCFYYPRLSPYAGDGGVAKSDRETKIEVGGTLQSLALHASFLALGHTDLNDGEAVLCYRSYFPAGTAALY